MRVQSRGDLSSPSQRPAAVRPRPRRDVSRNRTSDRAGADMVAQTTAFRPRPAFGRSFARRPPAHGAGNPPDALGRPLARPRRGPGNRRPRAAKRTLHRSEPHALLRANGEQAWSILDALPWLSRELGGCANPSVKLKPFPILTLSTSRHWRRDDVTFSWAVLQLRGCLERRAAGLLRQRRRQHRRLQRVLGRASLSVEPESSLSRRSRSRTQRRLVQYASILLLPR